MYLEQFNTETKINEKATCKTAYGEKHNHKFIGEVTDVFINPATGERTPVHHGFNLVVDDCSVIIAMLMKGEGTPLQYMAVGTGSTNWDNDNLPEPEATDVKLLNETFRKAVQSSDIKFIDDDNNVSTTPTNRIQVTVTFLEDEANGELREMGFFSCGATADKNTGHLVNRKIHPIIYKTTGMQLERTVRFTF